MMKYSKYFNVWLLVVSMSLFTACVTEDNAVDPGVPQDGEITEFFNAIVNKMIDENYEKVKANGYAELVIPASLYPKGMIKMPAADMEAMDYVIKAGHTVYINGGAVRDGVMGKDLNDVDFSTDATIDELLAIVPNSHKTMASKVELVQAEHEDGMRTDMVPYRGMDIRLKDLSGVPESEYFGQAYSKYLIDDSF